MLAFKELNLCSAPTTSMSYHFTFSCSRSETMMETNFCGKILLWFILNILKLIWTGKNKQYKVHLLSLYFRVSDPEIKVSLPVTQFNQTVYFSLFYYQ